MSWRANEFRSPQKNQWKRYVYQSKSSFMQLFSPLSLFFLPISLSSFFLLFYAFYFFIVGEKEPVPLSLSPSPKEEEKKVVWHPKNDKQKFLGPSFYYQKEKKFPKKKKSFLQKNNLLMCMYKKKKLRKQIK